MNRLSIFGISLFVLSAVLAYAHFEPGSFWWLGVGSTMGIGFFSILSSFQKTDTPAPSQEGKIASLETQIKTAQSTIEKEIAERSRLAETFRKKLQEAHEKCDAYKKLVDIHQFEIDKLRQENKAMSEEVLIRTQRITELELYLEDPQPSVAENLDLEPSHVFSQVQYKELEFLYNQLKKQLEEKNSLLDQIRVEFFQLENKFLVLQKEKSAEVKNSAPSLAHQLAQVEEEKQKLKTELTAVQELVTQLSAKKKRAPKTTSDTEPSRRKKSVKDSIPNQLT